MRLREPGAPLCHACQAAGLRETDVCARCEARVFANSLPCAGACVVEDGRILLVRRRQEPWAEHWDLPGGHCEAGEHPRTACARETLEETGYPIETFGILGVWLQPGPHFPSLITYYHAGAAAPPRARPAAEEVSAAEWFPLERLPSNLAFPEHIPEVLEALRQVIADAGPGWRWAQARGR